MGFGMSVALMGGFKAMADWLPREKIAFGNGIIFTAGRVYYAMAKDGYFFRSAAKLNKNEVPANALTMQCIWACLLCFSGTYGNLLDYIMFVVMLFYALTIAGLFRLRMKRPDMERPYKAFGYPILPALYILMGAAFCILLIQYKPEFTWPGLIIVLLGVPLYYMAISRNKGQTTN